MKIGRAFFLAAGIAAVLGAAGVGFAAADQTASQTPAPAASPFVVIIKDNAFSPAKLTVPVGATVTWKNQDSYAHTVTAQVKGAFDSGDLAGGKTFSATFPKAGTFNYVCSYHQGMTGVVVVGKSDQPQSTPTPTGY